METLTSPLPLYAVLVSLLAAVLIGFSGQKPNLREFWTIAAAVIKFGLVAAMLPAVLQGRIIEFTVLPVLPGLELKFKVDALGLVFGLVASFLWIITSFYSIGYVRSLQEKAQTRYFACFAIALAATMGVAFSANLFTTFVFYEIITLCTFPLVAHKGTAEALSGARRYIVYLLGTSLAFQLPAIFLTYHLAGTLDFAHQGIFQGAGVSAGLLGLIFFLFMAGITKAAIMPFHSWLPAAMVAPTPVSALLHAVAVVKTGVFVVIKVVLHVFGVDLLADLGFAVILAYVAAFTIVAASVIALTQDNLKARLAYSTISQLSYVILGVALLTPMAIAGSILQIVVHAFGKITLFFTAGAIYVAAHKTNISELNGIGRQMPFTMAAFTVGALSMIGIPPLGGFLSKWYLGLGAVEAGQLPVLLVLMTSTVLNACYFLPIVYAAFFKEPTPDPQDSHHQEEAGQIREAPVMMLWPLLLTAFGAIGLFFVPAVFLDLTRMIVQAATGGS
ncbi:MAG: monovalent cation/H+ antiporter subunit D family protein [Syntrophomonadaceae bacterium]|nr:monovalent cation/H+ antiporter subunit D family protein [Syntrophomonadaceae bacterium]